MAEVEGHSGMTEEEMREAGWTPASAPKAPPTPQTPPPPAEAPPASAPPSSLEARMRARAEQLAARTTEIFPVPRFDSVLAVELRAIEWERSEEIITRNQRIPKQAMLNSSADEIVAATVAFYEIPEGADDIDDLQPLGDDVTWRAMVERYLGQSLAAMPSRTADRIALKQLCGSQGAMALSSSYRRWLGGEETGLRSELSADFDSTP